MKIVIFALLLAVALSSCAPVVTPAPAATQILPAPTTIMPTVAPPPTNTATAPAPDTQPLAADLDTTFQELTEAYEFSGSILIAKDGQVILSKGYGFADRDKNIPNAVQTKFAILGITKQFTAMAIMILQEQGKLNVQDKICATLTDCPEAWKPITIHQLLTQTSGIPDIIEQYATQKPTSSAPLEQMIADVKTMPLDSQPGEQFIPENISYVLLGKIIEAVSGQSYKAFLQKNIFEPLQMSNTGFDPNRADLAVGYADQASVAEPFNMGVMFSTSGLYSTVEDLYRYDRALQTSKLVPQKVLDTMFTSYVQSDRDGSGYGYGWYIGLDKPHINKIFGQLNGFNTTFRRYLDDKVTVIVLLNQEDNDIVAVANSIADRLLASPTITAIPSPEPTASLSGPVPWSLVAVGDSIPFNSPDDCHGCTSFVDRYAATIFEATGHPVTVQNLSQHNGLQIDGFLAFLKTNAKRREVLANADIIIVGIAHNDVAWNRDDDPCDGPNGDNPDWSKYNATCTAEAAEIFRPKFESVYAQIVALRAGKPTIFLTINRYNDWIGWPGHVVPPEATNATRDVVDVWSAMICEAAQANGFTCADIYHAFNGPNGLTSAGDLLARDYIHPSDKGNAVIAEVLADLGYAPLTP